MVAISVAHKFSLFLFIFLKKVYSVVSWKQKLPSLPEKPAPQIWWCLKNYSPVFCWPRCLISAFRTTVQVWTCYIRSVVTAVRERTATPLVICTKKTNEKKNVQWFFFFFSFFFVFVFESVLVPISIEYFAHTMGKVSCPKRVLEWIQKFKEAQTISVSHKEGPDARPHPWLMTRLSVHVNWRRMMLQTICKAEKALPTW